MIQEKFEIYPFKVTVMVFPSAPLLRAHLRSLREHYEIRAAAGIVAFTSKANEMLFAVGEIDLDTVTHEAFHAASLWAGHHSIPLENRMKWRDPDHERVAEYHGRLVHRLVKEFKKRALID